MTTAIPAITEEPFVYVEFDATQAGTGPSLKAYKALLISQRITAGTVAELVPTRVASAEEASTFFGQGSLAHRMAIAWFANNISTETWMVTQDDAGGAVKATKTVTITGTATAAGTLFLYIGGDQVRVAIAVGDTATVMGDSVVAAIAAAGNLPVTSANAVGVVTLTAKNGGTLGEALDVRLNYNPGEATPAGATVVIADVATGVTDPVLSAVWASLGDVQYDVWAVGNDTAANMTALDAELDDRWGPLRAIEGVAVVGTKGSHSTLLTKGGTMNSEFVALSGAANGLNLPCEWAAATAANVAFYGADDPARPFKSLVLKSILAPAAADRFDLTEREALIAAGVATWVVDGSGSVAISREVATYKTNAQAVADKSFQDLNTVLILGYLRYDFRAQVSTKYPRHKLADDGNEFGAGQKVMTPSVMRGEAIAIARGWASLGLIENVDDFIAGLTVDRDPQNVSRLNVHMPPDLVNKFLVTAATVAFKL